MATPILGLPELEAAQGQKYLTVNQTSRRLDVLINLTVFNRTVTSPPVSPSDGHRYIVGSPATGGFAGQENNIAAFIGTAWVFFTPSEGWRAYDQGANQFIVFNGSAWVLAGLSSSALSDGSVNLMGVGATPDTTNRLSVKSPGVLFNAETDDFRLTFNKATAGDDVGFLLQTGFSTRALIGLLGSDDMTFKVTPDGSTFYDAIVIDKDTGNVAIGAGSDANNKLLVSGTSMLFTNSDDLRFTFNKGSSGDDVALTFQSGFSARALIGLLGDDDFTFKVTPDGSTFYPAIVIDKDTGSVSFESMPKFAGYCNYDQYNAADAWFKVDINNMEHNDQGAVSSGVFTAPQDGYYLMGAGCLLLSDGTPPSVMSIGFSINNADPLPRHLTRSGDGSASMDSSSGLTISYLMKLSAGDTVQVKARFAAGDSSLTANYSTFWGHQVA